MQLAGDDIYGQQENREVDLNTLDEPVWDTMKRDLRAIGQKLYYVMLPRARVDKVNKHRFLPNSIY